MTALVLAACLSLPAPWTTADTAREAALVAVAAVDVGQTRWGQEHGHVEVNPVLGRHPSPARLRLTVLGALLGHAVVAYLLPRPWRLVWQLVPLELDLMAVGGNMITQAGLHWEW